jgi:hypothetical protein
MLTRLALVCFVLLGLNACDSGSEPGALNYAELFPYQVGDTIAYADTFGGGPVTTLDSVLRDTVRVVGTTTIGNDVYQIHQIDHDSVTIIDIGRIKPVMDSEYYFIDGSKIYQWWNESKTSIADFAKPFTPGTTTDDFMRFEAHYVKDTVVTVVAGTFNTKLLECGELLGIRRYYAAGVGMVLMTQNNYRRELLSAKVGGRSYP